MNCTNIILVNFTNKKKTMKPQSNTSNNYSEKVTIGKKNSHSPKLRYKQLIKAQMEKISRLEKENADLFETTKLIAVKDKASK